MANINNSITQDDVSALLNTTIAQMRGGGNSKSFNRRLHQHSADRAA